MYMAWWHSCMCRAIASSLNHSGQSNFAWGGYGSLMSEAQANESTARGALFMAGAAASPEVSAGKPLAFMILPPAQNYVKNSLHAVAEAVATMEVPEDGGPVRVGTIHTPPLENMCGGVPALATQLGMQSISSIDVTVSKHPSHAEVDAALTILRDRRVNFIVGCCYQSSCTAVINGLEVRPG